LLETDLSEIQNHFHSSEEKFWFPIFLWRDFKTCGVVSFLEIDLLGCD